MPAAAPSAAPLPAAERRALWAGVIAVSAAAWGWLAHMALRMDAFMRGGALEAWMPPVAGWSGRDFGMLFLMWAVMMAAMMTPSALPLLKMYRSAARGRARARLEPAAAWGWLLAGYLAAWTLFSGLAAFAQWPLHAWRLLDPMMESRSLALSGGLLAVAGLYQWTPWKDACLRQCRTPLQFLMARWRDGAAGAARMGLEHGLYCIGCCWALMLVLVALGMMNILWVAAVAVFVIVEKGLPAPARTFRAATGLLLLAAGAWLLAGAPGAGA